MTSARTGVRARACRRARRCRCARCPSSRCARRRSSGDRPRCCPSAPEAGPRPARSCRRGRAGSRRRAPRAPARRARRTALSARSARSPKPSRMTSTSGFGRAVIRRDHSTGRAAPGHPPRGLRGKKRPRCRGSKRRCGGSACSPVRRPTERSRSRAAASRSATTRRTVEPTARPRATSRSRAGAALLAATTPASPWPRARPRPRTREGEASSRTASPAGRVGRVYGRRVLGQSGAGGLRGRARVSRGQDARGVRVPRRGDEQRRRAHGHPARGRVDPGSGAAASSSTPTASTRSACCRRAGRPRSIRSSWPERSASCETRGARLVYVPGHSGVPLNERADELAREAIDAPPRARRVLVPEGT